MLHRSLLQQACMSQYYVNVCSKFVITSVFVDERTHIVDLVDSPNTLQRSEIYKS